MRFSGKELVDLITQETDEVGPGCVIDDPVHEDRARHEVPEIRQTWLPEDTPPLPALVWCFTHAKWERKPKEEKNDG